jgi:hypothetical protein
VVEPACTFSGYPLIRFMANSSSLTANGIKKEMLGPEGCDELDAHDRRPALQRRWWRYREVQTGGNDARLDFPPARRWFCHNGLASAYARRAGETSSQSRASGHFRG